MTVCPSCGRRGVTVGLSGTLIETHPVVRASHACGLSTYSMPEE